MRIYLDNCCYNRPYDDQSHLRISLEAQAKLRIQQMIREQQLELAASYTLLYENGNNPHETRKSVIRNFIKQYKTSYVDIDQADSVMEKADRIIATGVKTADAYHIASAILSDCDYFLTTDDRLLKYQTDEITITDPTEFIRTLGEGR